MRVAVFRAQSDGERTARRLAERGLEAVLAPVIALERTSVPIPPSAADGVVFTSAHAPDALSGQPQPRWFTRLPCWCVGQRTGAAARALGFGQVDSGSVDAAQLADLLQARCAPGARLLLLVGRDHKPLLPNRLVAAGFDPEVLPIYDAVAIPRWTRAEADAIGRCDVALHYSRRSAELAMRMAAAHGLIAPLRPPWHHCLSRDVAAAVEPMLPRDLSWADTPDEASLLESLVAHRRTSST